MKLSTSRLKEIIREEIAAIGEDVQYKSTHSRASRSHGSLVGASEKIAASHGSDEKPFQEGNRVKKAGYGEGKVHSVRQHPDFGWVVDVNWGDGSPPETHEASTLNLVK